MMFLVFRGIAHLAAVGGVIWILAFGAHALGLVEDARIVEMAAWERAVLVVWGVAAAEWWRQWSRYRRTGPT